MGNCWKTSNHKPNNLGYSTNRWFSIFNSIEMHPTDQIQLHQDLNNLQVWSVDNSMKFNVKKCKHLCITKKKTPLIINNYTINGANILKTDFEKDLGVHISSDMSWNTRVKKVVNSAYKMFGLIYRICRNNCDQRTLETFYRNLVHPHLEYATQVWSPAGIGILRN